MKRLRYRSSPEWNKKSRRTDVVGLSRAPPSSRKRLLKTTDSDTTALIAASIAVSQGPDRALIRRNSRRTVRASSRRGSRSLGIRLNGIRDAFLLHPVARLASENLILDHIVEMERRLGHRALRTLLLASELRSCAALINGRIGTRMLPDSLDSPVLAFPDHCTQSSL